MRVSAAREIKTLVSTSREQDKADVEIIVTVCASKPGAGRAASHALLVGRFEAGQDAARERPKLAVVGGDVAGQFG